jgi:hypothetical protein
MFVSLTAAGRGFHPEASGPFYVHLLTLSHLRPRSADTIRDFSSLANQDTCGVGVPENKTGDVYNRVEEHTIAREDRPA